MKKILSTRVLVKICVLTTILLVLIIYTIWGNSALMVSMVNISSDRIALLKMPVQFPGIYSVLYYSPIKQYKYKK